MLFTGTGVGGASEEGASVDSAVGVPFFLGGTRSLKNCID